MIEVLTEGKSEKVYISDMSGEKSLMALMQEQKIPIMALCNGKGECGRCRVRFLFGAPVPTEKESRLLKSEELDCGIRLACAVHVTEPCQILLEESGEEHMAVLMETQEKRKIYRDKKKKEGYGIAIDIGTTTLAAELFDLSDGENVSAAFGVNHQRAFGADVISRISAANEGKAELLMSSIRADLKELVHKLLQEKICTQDVKQIVIVGNTTMCHLLRGLSCEGLGSAPFTPTDNSFYETTAEELFGVDGWQANVTILPGISAFVGADIVSGIYASGMCKREGTSMMLDIGTNSEMVLYDKGELFVTSAAAGPVFEGGNISCGMPGVPGAICRITAGINGWKYETIDQKAPNGICGTGMIDFVSELMGKGWMDENGTLEEPWFTDGINVAEQVTICQKDIREIQLGKAAIRAGIETLLEKCDKQSGTCMSGSEKITVYLAGGFGHFMNVDHAIHIGLFPESFYDCTKSIGNGALDGAKRYLMCEDAKQEIAWIIGHAKEINLAEQPTFQELYLTHMFF